MKTEDIARSLNDIYENEKQRIIFWHDPEAEFADSVAELDLPDTTLVRLDKTGFLALKIRLEIEEPEKQFLLYAPFPEPAVAEDWLLDLRSFSRTFRADRASLLLNELELSHQSLRMHLNKRKAFFKSTERTAKLKKLLQPGDLEDALDWKMLAVVTKASQPNPFYVLMQLFRELAEAEPLDLSQPPKSWSDIEKFGLETTFWNGVAAAFGYAGHEKASQPLHDLLLRILVTDFIVHLQEQPPKSLQHLILSERTNCSVFVSQWQRDIQMFASYRNLSAAIGKELKIREVMAKLAVQSLADNATFEDAERRVLSGLRDTLVAGETFNQDDMKELIRQRRDCVWAQMKLSDVSDENPYAIAYNAIEDAMELFLLKEQHAQGFSFATSETMFKAYCSDLYQFDCFHRRFLAAADKIELLNWDILKTLREAVKSCYEEWYSDQLAANWSSLVDSPEEGAMLNSWKISGIKNQFDFFKGFVQPILDKAARNRVFVIISDALRYEAAAELTLNLNRQNRVKATIAPLLGVVPSYTALGMASLLPHDKITYDSDTGDLHIDGQLCASYQDRCKVLQKHEGVAIKGEDLLQMNQQEGRDAIQGARVVYIYHDRIDSVGDKAATEKHTPGVITKAIEELISLVRCVINNLNGANVFITADHGFLFQEQKLTATDKSELDNKPDKAFIAKKRFILGRKLKKTGKAWHGFTRNTAGTDDETEFWVPKGNNRFHFVGGAQFVHGGAMLQEIAVPVITIKELEGKSAQQAAVRKVGVSLLGSSRRVVNNFQKFEFIQTEKVSERNLPQSVTVSLRDGEELISNEVTLTFDSESDSMEERKRVAKIVLKKGNYDKKKEYYLVVRDADTQVELERISFNIDLAIMNDF